MTFTRSQSTDKEGDLNMTLYGEKIPLTSSPKFLEIMFDRRFSFKKHLENIEAKITDRFNFFIFFHITRTGALANTFSSECINMYVETKYEVIQNDALRIIFKNSKMGHVKVEDLRSMPRVTTIEERREDLFERYFERAIISNNPLMKLMFIKYDNFKKRET